MATRGRTAPGQSAWQREMVAAAIGGGGLDPLAELACDEAGSPIAIVLARGDDAGMSRGVTAAHLAGLREYVGALAAGEHPALPEIVIAEAPLTAGGELVGAVFMLDAGAANADERSGEILAVTAMATMTEVALGEAREDAGVTAPASVIERIRTDPDLSDTEIVRRAAGLGTDLGKGAVVLCAQARDGHPGRVVAIIRAEQPNALVEQLERGIYALVPPEAGPHPRGLSLDGAQRLADLLAPYAIVGVSSYCRQASLLHRAVAEAELVVTVLTHETGGGGDDDIGSPTYRLLINTLAKRPDEAMTFYYETIAPLVAHDKEHGTELAVTVDAYLRQNCNVSAAAAALDTHRQTATARLERVRELTGLDPKTSEGCERLSLGLKLHRILAPTLRL
jgi:PucR C-terminal helix-turn-helix domain/GGDEF-like domain